MVSIRQLGYAMPMLIHVLLVILVAVVAYWLLVPLAGLPVIVGAIAAILVLVLGFGGRVGGRTYW